MSKMKLSRRNTWIGLIVILLLASLILWTAPEEQDLGTGIRSVYVHVALTWTGMTGIVIAGLVGLTGAVLNREDLQSWANTITWVALAIFAAGMVMSVIAAGINWGGVFWQEPRTNTVLQVLAAGLIVQGLNSWPIPSRLKGILNFILAIVLLALVFTTPLVLHPGNAARTANSFAIRFTFFGLYGLCMLAAAWIVLAIRTNDRPSQTASVN
jgi:hypothetical protein